MKTLDKRWLTINVGDEILSVTTSSIIEIIYNVKSTHVHGSDEEGEEKDQGWRAIATFKKHIPTNFCNSNMCDTNITLASSFIRSTN